MNCPMARQISFWLGIPRSELGLGRHLRGHSCGWMEQSEIRDGEPSWHAALEASSGNPTRHE